MNICTAHSVSLIHQGEVMFTLEQSKKAQRCSFTLPLSSVLDGGQGSTTCSSLQETDPSTHSTGGWVGPRASLDTYQKISHPPQFIPQTTQPVASHHTNYVILAHKSNFYFTYSSLNRLCNVTLSRTFLLLPITQKLALVY
jgi:hypothetical protein